MASTKITPDYPGAYSGLVAPWEKEKRRQLKMLPRYEGFRPSLALVQ